jgi:two-component system, cell cycle sensor histidine kinase and response regulator CckA
LRNRKPARKELEKQDRSLVAHDTLDASQIEIRESIQKADIGFHKTGGLYDLLALHKRDIIFFIRQSDGRIVEVNDATISSYGYSREEMLSFNIHNLLLPEMHSAIRSHLDDAGPTGTIFETIHRRKDGTCFPVEVSSIAAEIEGERIVVSIIRDITERRQLEEEVVNRLRFETLLANLSSQLMDVPEERLDGQIESAQRSICEYLGFDLSSLWQRRAETENSYAITHHFQSSGYVLLPNGMDANTLFPWSLRQMKAGKIIAFSSPESMPPEAAPDQATWRRSHIKSILMFPLMVGGEPPIGFLAFNTIQSEHTWTEPIVKRLQLIAQVFANALARRRSAQLIREGNARLDQLTMHSRTVIWEMDDQGLYTYISRSVQPAWGYQPEELVGRRRFYELHPDDGREAFRAAAFARFERKEEYLDYTTRVQCKDGRILWVLSNGIPLLNPDGTLRGYRGGGIDITERMETEEQLRMFKFSLDQAPSAYWHDASGRFLYANESGCRELGYELQELLQLRVHDINPRVIPERWQKVWESIKSGGAIRMESRHRRKDGTVFPVEVSSTYFQYGDKEYCTAFVFDITERKQAEQALRDSEEKFRKAFMTGTDAFSISTIEEGLIIECNKEFENLFGYSRDEILGKTTLQLNLYSDPVDRTRIISMVQTDGHVKDFELRGRRKNGDAIYASFSGALVSINNKPHCLAVIRDITEHRQLEEQFRQAQKMKAIGQLAGGVAHDFNNILSGIMMNIGLIENRPHLDSQIEQAFKELKSEVNRAASLTRQLLLFSRRSVMDMKMLDLNEIVANMHKMLARLIGEHIKLRFNRCDHLPIIKADTGMLEQVIMNLAVNARDAMPKGGTITISIDTVEVGREEIKNHPEIRPGRFVRLSVSDTGCGMDEDTRKRLFEPFFTTKELGKGTGLGLATIYGIVARHHGWVDVISEISKGATFRIFLPANETSELNSAQIEKQAVHCGNETILLVEDDQILRITTAQGLRSLGYRIIEAGNGREAIKKWQDHSLQINVLFSDVVMPEGMTGLDLAKKLRESAPDLKVVLSSGYAEVSNLKRRAKGMVYLQKPYTIETISKAIRDCLR